MSTQSIGNSLTDLVAPLLAIAVAFTCAPAAALQQPKPFLREEGADRFSRRLLEKVMSGLDQNWRGFASQEEYLRLRSGGLNAG